MSDETYFSTLINDLYNKVGYLFEGLTDALYGGAESLRDGTEHEPVQLPRDLAAHDNVQTEWWYYTGHAQTNSGRRFGFELVFFKRRTDLDSFSVVPLRLFGNPLYFAHFAVTDLEEKTFRYAHRKSSNGIFDYPASTNQRHFYIRLGDWSLREARGAHILRASIDSDFTFEASLVPAKIVTLNGEDGVSFKDVGEASRYFSYTRMNVDGDIVRNGETEHFTGAAWMDREFGTWTPTENQKGWDWFSIQLDNNCELMCYQLRNGSGGVSPYSSGMFVDTDSKSIKLAASDFVIEPTGYWKSKKSGATYPSGWRLTVASLDLQLSINPVIEDQELDTRGSTMIIYWEGACEVAGSFRGLNVVGNAYVELVGYDRSHDQPNLAYFLMGDSFQYIKKIIAQNK